VDKKGSMSDGEVESREPGGGAMIKLIMLLKRRPDLSMEEFIDRYENRHAKLAEPHIRKSACRYVRRYLHQVPDPVLGDMPEPEFDVISEIWFEGEMRPPGSGGEDGDESWQTLMADEPNLFDMSRRRFFVVEECESDLTT
jgi:hypothetical protein